MAAVTEEIMSNLLRSNLTNLKSFAEMLNAEFTEEEHDEQNRDKFKEEISRILDKFGSSEGDFLKRVRCLTQTKNEVYAGIANDPDECDRHQLIKDIDEIVNIIEGKSRLADDEPVLDMEMDEARYLQLIERAEDILNEFNPLKYRDEEDDEDETNDREEQKLSKVLEDFQKKSMKKLEHSMLEDAENAMEVDSETSDEDEENDEATAATQATQRASALNEREKKAMDLKLREMWKNYETKISRIAPRDLKEVYQSKLDQMRDMPLGSLTHFPKYNKDILDLFSREAIVVLSEKQNYLDPISKMEIKVPLRNKKCGHVYDKDTILSVLKRKKEISCPCLGCSCRSFTLNDLEEDEDLAEKITQSLSRMATSSRQSTGENSYAEYLDSDNDDDL